MPLLKSREQREREAHNRAMIDDAHNNPRAFNHGHNDHPTTGTFGASGPGGGFGGQEPHGPGYTGDNYQRGTTGATDHRSAFTHSEIPPAGALGHGNNTGSSGGSGRLTGKVEAALGSAVGSESLRAKGMQKQYEAEAFKRQGAELAEAERLENEARVRRERAVAHGAHPTNLQQGTGLADPLNHHGQGQEYAPGGRGGSGW